MIQTDDIAFFQAWLLFATATLINSFLTEACLPVWCMFLHLYRHNHIKLMLAHIKMINNCWNIKSQNTAALFEPLWMMYEKGGLLCPIQQRMVITNVFLQSNSTTKSSISPVNGSAHTLRLKRSPTFRGVLSPNTKLHGGTWSNRLMNSVLQMMMSPVNLSIGILFNFFILLPLRGKVVQNHWEMVSQDMNVPLSKAKQMGSSPTALICCSSGEEQADRSSPHPTVPLRQLRELSPCGVYQLSMINLDDNLICKTPTALASSSKLLDLDRPASYNISPSSSKYFLATVASSWIGLATPLGTAPPCLWKLKPVALIEALITPLSVAMVWGTVDCCICPFLPFIPTPMVAAELTLLSSCLD